MKAILVDDEKMALMSLKGLLNESFPEVSVIAECQNVPEAVRAIQRLSPDVVFLDVEMPEYNGFELFEFLKPSQIDFHIVFVTAYSEHSLRAFEFAATDYLLKPVRAGHLERALAKIRASQPKPDQYQALADNLKEDSAVCQKLILQTATDIYVVHVGDIICLEAQGSYTNFVTASHGELLISKKISDFLFLESLPTFFRCHRSFMINLEKIFRIDKRNNHIFMENNRQILLAQDRRKDLLDKISTGIGQ